MEHPLRITFKNNDYTFQLIRNIPITRETTEFHILLDGTPITIRKEVRGWVADSTEDPELIDAIGRTLALRYRI
ncbi:MAG TPA: hypothetical protein VGD92_02085 [Sphingobacteriaceae bacterium]